MGEAASTAVLTVEDIGEKFPDSRSELKFLVPLQDFTIKIGDKHRFSVQGEAGGWVQWLDILTESTASPELTKFLNVWKD